MTTPLTTAQQALSRAQQALATKQETANDLSAGPMRTVDIPTTTVDLTGLGTHHPSVARWAGLVRFLFGQVGYADETNYALMVMWGESGGDPKAVGPTLYTSSGSATEAHGLFQHMRHLFAQRRDAAAAFWRARGITIGTDPADPLTNIAVAAYLRAVAGWGQWAVTHDWYKEGAWGEDTFWDGVQYRNLAVPSNTVPPRGDGQVSNPPGVSPALQGGSGGGAGFIHPLPGFSVTGHFGDSRDNGARSHEGTDFGAPEGTPIRATRGGRIVSIGPGTEAAGLQVTIDHGNGWSSFYCHIRPGSFKVKVGQQVRAGDIIAEVGETGNANGPHLHFEISQNGVAQDVEKLGVTEQLNPGDDDIFVSGGKTGEITKRDRLRAALLGSIDAISRSVAGGMRAPLPGTSPEWTGPDQTASTPAETPLSPVKEIV